MNPTNRKELYLNCIANGHAPDCEPANREEMMLHQIAECSGGGIPVICVFTDETAADQPSVFVEEVKDWTFDNMERMNPVTEPRVLSGGEVGEILSGKHCVFLVLYTKKLLGGVAGWIPSTTYLCMRDSYPNNNMILAGTYELVSSTASTKKGAYVEYDEDYNVVGVYTW